MTTATTIFLQGVARDLDHTLNASGEKKNGFVLLVFPFDAPEGARVNYVSNTQRPDTLTALKEIVARFEGQSQQRGTA